MRFGAFAWSARAEAGTESQKTARWKSRGVNDPAALYVSTTTPPTNGSNETVTCPGGTVDHELVEFELAPIVAW